MYKLWVGGFKYCLWTIRGPWGQKTLRSTDILSHSCRRGWPLCLLLDLWNSVRRVLPGREIDREREGRKGWRGRGRQAHTQPFLFCPLLSPLARIWRQELARERAPPFTFRESRPAHWAARSCDARSALQGDFKHLDKKLFHNSGRFFGVKGLSSLIRLCHLDVFHAAKTHKRQTYNLRILSPTCK